MGESRPLQSGPRLLESPVIVSTKIVARIIRSGISHQPGLKGCTANGGLGRSLSDPMLTMKTTINPDHKPSDSGLRIKMVVKNDSNPSVKLIGQRKRGALNPYPKQKAQVATDPARVPMAAWAANSGPCCKAKKTEIGPLVSGKATIQPPTWLPNRRLSQLAAATRMGERISLKARRESNGDRSPYIEFD